MRGKKQRIGLVAGLLGAVVLNCGVAFGVSERGSWEVGVTAGPSVFSTDNEEACLQETNTGLGTDPSCDVFTVLVRDSGLGGTDGSSVTVDGTLPAGVVARRVQFFWSGVGRLNAPGVLESSDLAGHPFPGDPVSCQLVPVSCRIEAEVRSDDILRMVVYATVDSSVGGSVTGAFKVTGGSVPEEAGSVTASTSGSAAFGVTGFSANVTGEDGAPFTQAAGHPYELTDRIAFNSVVRESPSDVEARPAVTSVQDVKDVILDLPLGFLGSARAAAKCTFAELSSLSHCPANTVVGRLTSLPESGASVNSALYNMVPEHGVPAEFGFVDLLDGAHALYASVVPSPQGYRLRTVSRWVPQVALTSIVATLYGDPAEKNGGGGAPGALFTNPAQCSGEPMRTDLYVDSWQNPAPFGADGEPELRDPRWVTASAASPPVTGCNSLAFDPEAFSVQPDTTLADSPSGLMFELGVPQSELPGTLGTPPLRNATVKLPAGLSVNPASAEGLEGCSIAQIGWLGRSISDFSAAPPSCPDGSKIGTVEIETPLLDSTLSGAVYLAAPEANPFGALIAGYIAVDDPVTGVVVKIAGEISLDPSTGQITGTFDQNPQLPFSRFRLHFFGGAHGDLATPPECGTYTTTGTFEPWSAPDSPVVPEQGSSFPVSGGCAPGFTPTLQAGMSSPQAGSYSPFVLTFSRTDQDQFFAAANVTLPAGLVAKLAGVPLCGESQAAAGTCPADTQIGTVEAGAGVGPDPYFLAGRVYLTGPYNGGSFGLSVVVPAIAGPFNLGNVVVRESLRINPETAQVTAVSDPFPTIVKGVPVRLRQVHVRIDRNEFTLNPTNCTPTAITATFRSAQSVQSDGSARYEAAGCRELGFHPVLTATTNGKTSRVNGVSLNVTVKARRGQANIKSVHVELPKALPSRLSTLNHACPDSVFNRDPAGCPSQSRVGFAKAVTPVLPVPLEGPAYFVSHGGQKFPELIVVLQGYGVIVYLEGETFISKAGVTSSTFKSVPDVPVGTFELTLPEGPFSALAANRDLCTTSLAMPTTFTGQNGAVVKQNTKIAVTGCRPAIHVVGHSVKGAHASIRVSVPSAGTLVASGKGIGRSVKRAGKAGIVTIGVTLSGRDLRVLAKNPHQRVNAKVKLRFKPRHGAALTATVRLLMG